MIIETKPDCVLCTAENDRERLSLCGIEAFWAESHDIGMDYRRSATRHGKSFIRIRIPLAAWEKFESSVRSHTLGPRSEHVRMPEWEAYERKILAPKFKRRRMKKLLRWLIWITSAAAVGSVAWLFGGG